MRRTYRRKKYMGKGKTTLAKIAKQVRLLTRRDKIQTIKVSYRTNDSISTESMNPYIGKLLTNYSGWTTLWPSTSTAASNLYDKARIKSIHMDNLVTLDNGVNTERSSISFTYIVFRPRECAGPIPTTTTALGTTLVPTLTPDVDYTVYYGKAFMNLHKYKVLYIKRFTLTQAENANGDAARIQVRFKHKIKLNTVARSFDDNWKDMTEDLNETNNVYAVLFSDNSIVDGQVPRWEYSMLASVEH